MGFHTDQLAIDPAAQLDPFGIPHNARDRITQYLALRPAINYNLDFY
jgi:hypothetical protein